MEDPCFDVKKKTLSLIELLSHYSYITEEDHKMAALANALYKATGTRMYQQPYINQVELLG